MKHIKIIFFLMLPVCINAQALFMFAGQSNMRGSGIDSLSVIPAPGTAWDYDWGGDSLKPLIDPVGDNHGPFQSAVTGSLIPAFADQYHQLTGDTVYTVGCAKGGSPMVSGGWSGSLRWNAVWKTQAATAATGLQPSGIIWLQGEEDGTDLNNGLITRDQYRDSLISLRQYWRSNLGADLPFFIIAVGLNTLLPDSGYNEIRAAQYEVAATDSLTWIVYDSTNLFPAMGLMGDKVHYSQEGYNRVGRGAAKAIAEIFAGNCHPVPARSFDVVASENPSPGFIRVAAPGSGAWSIYVSAANRYHTEYLGNSWPGAYNIPLQPGLYLARITISGLIHEKILLVY